MSSRVLILTTAANYTPAQTLPFRRSLAACGFDGKLVMLMEPRSIRAHKPHVAANVEFLPYTAPRSTYRKTLLRSLKRPLGRLLHRPLLALNRRQPLLSYKLASFFNHISINRNFYYHDYVARHGDAYDWIIVTDCRDVLFQSNPAGVLAREHPDGRPLLAAGLEAETSVIGQDLFTTRWIANAFGAQTVDDLRGLRISCSGAVYGTPSAMQGYLRVMSDALVGVTRRMRGRFGYDQGAHNVVLRRNQVPHLRLTENFTSPVANLGDLDEAMLLDLCADGTLRRTDTGEPVMLVHQYDRYPALTKALLDRLDAAT